MAGEYHHGVTLIKVTDGLRAIRNAKFSCVGMVCTSDDADADVFPLNEAVLLDGDPAYYLSKAGVDGTLAKALNGMYDQGNPICVVVRVAEGVDAAATTTNIIGGATAGQFTGMQALLDAKNKWGFSPRILGVPGGLDNAAVAVELVSIATKLRSFAYLHAHDCDDATEALAYRDTFGSERAMVLWPQVQVWDSVALASVYESPVARALGLRAYLDTVNGPHWLLSNNVIQGVTGASKSIHWDLLDPNTTAGTLNAGEVTCIIRENGYRFWGVRTCSADPANAFENAVRLTDLLGDTIAESHLWAMDRPMSRQLIGDIVEGINAKLREWKAMGWILNGKASLPVDGRNSQATLAAGQLYIDYDFEPPPPLENLILTQRRQGAYLIELVS